MILAKYEDLEKIVKAKGYKWFVEALKPNIVAIRTNLIVPNVYNDIMCVAYVDKVGKKFFFTYSITTLPGKFWLKNPLNPKGCGILIPGQYVDGWVKGTHGKTRPHDALLQIGAGVNIYRDNDKDEIPDFSGPGVTIEKNVFIGLNLHASWAIGDRKNIDKDSAACQVSATSWAHENILMKAVDNYIISQLGYLPTNSQIMNDRKLQVKFTYTLLVEKDLK